jgi:hypothetical protein
MNTWMEDFCPTCGSRDWTTITKTTADPPPCAKRTVEHRCMCGFLEFAVWERGVLVFIGKGQNDPQPNDLRVELP